MPIEGINIALLNNLKGKKQTETKERLEHSWLYYLGVTLLHKRNRHADAKEKEINKTNMAVTQ